MDVAGASEDRTRMKYALLEQLGIVIYYTWNVALLLQLPLLEAIVFFSFAQMLCGLLLAIVFGVGHNGMKTYEADKRPDFWKLQVTTTRNVTSTPFIDWFCGGLQYQVDHHLFPTLPRHNLRKAHELVSSFCREHGVSYHETDLLTGTLEVLKHLRSVSIEFVHHFPAM
jgi:fatty acid desaturase